jgi:HAD superfamily hydrolase (TIGR01509 family)
MLKALLFDLDGTMVNTDPVHYQTWQDILQPYGIQFNPTFYRQHFSGRRNAEILKDLLPDFTDQQIEDFSIYKEAEFRQRAQDLQRTPGLTEFLSWTNQQHLRRAVVTNAPRQNAEFMLQVLQLQDVFPVVILADELVVGKPDPLPYQLAVSQLGVLPEASIAFEDSPSGLRSAIGAGIPTVGIASTHAAEELYELGAILVIENFADVRLMERLQQQVEPMCSR